MDSTKLATALAGKYGKASDVEESDTDDGGGDDASVPEGAIAAAEDIMDVLSSYGPGAPSDSDSKVEKATKEASRRAKAKILAGAL
jgi:hypothetical protein